MRRIAIVTDWFAPRRGGIESQLHELASRLALGGDHVDVFTTTPGPPPSPAARYGVHRLDVWRLPSPPVAVSPRMFRKLRRGLESGYDVVHAHVSVVSPLAWGGAFVARSMELPTAVTFHSVLRGKALALRAVSAVTPLGGAPVAWSAVSGRVAGQVSWALRNSEVSVLPNGIDVAWWGQGPGREPRDEVTFVAAMRLHRKKRGRVLLRAFAEAARTSRRRARLIVVGDGPERARMQRDVQALQSRLGVASIELRGWLDPEELRALYSAADAFVMPSVHESFGIGALEAAAAGLPIVARRSGIAEFVVDGRNGLLVDSDEDLATAMRSLIDDDDYRQRLRPDAPPLARFDWPVVAAAHQREYERANRLAATPVQAVAASA